MLVWVDNIFNAEKRRRALLLLSNITKSLRKEMGDYPWIEGDG